MLIQIQLTAEAAQALERWCTATGAARRGVASQIASKAIAFTLGSPQAQAVVDQAMQAMQLASSASMHIDLPASGASHHTASPASPASGASPASPRRVRARPAEPPAPQLPPLGAGADAEASDALFTTPPNCHACKAPMRLRRVPGGQAFFGCVNYPNCKGTADVSAVAWRRQQEEAKASKEREAAERQQRLARVKEETRQRVAELEAEAAALREGRRA